MCVVSVIVKRPVLPLCVVDGRSRNPLYLLLLYNNNKKQIGNIKNIHKSDRPVSTLSMISQIDADLLKSSSDYEQLVCYSLPVKVA